MKNGNRNLIEKTQFGPKRKKDFKLSEEIVREFELYAPSGKQTAIVETLIAEWITAQKRQERAADIRRAYEREGSPPTSGGDTED